ncbi:MAG: Bug family tripartite tricarboxylate transporter substrate binding protein [Candidatus Binatia bacterium]
MRYGMNALVVTVSLVLVAGPVYGSSHDFYKGATMRLVVGFAAGGGFDTYSRTIARHLGKHIPGNPTIVVENMTGAGGLIAANHLYRAAKPDGLTIGNIIGGLFMAQLLGRAGIEFDALKFGYLGVPAKDHPTCVFMKESGITSIEKWMASKTPVKVGGTGPGATTYDNPRILQVALDLPIQVVGGYKGTAGIRLAAERGEVAGGCGWGWDSVRATWSKAVASGDAVVVLQSTSHAHPELANVPLAINFAKSEESRQLIQAGSHDMNALTRSYVIPPGTPKDRLQVLRKAFMETMKDPAFLSEANKAKLNIDPISGEEMETTVRRLFKLSPAIVDRLKEVLK